MAIWEEINNSDFKVVEFEHFKLKEFNLLCEESQSWAKENNVTEDDIKTAVKSVRAEKNSK